MQESVQAHESYVVPHHLHPPTGDLHHHDLLRGPIPIPLLQYLGRWPEKLLLNINLMILLPQIHYRLISNISLFVPHRQPYLLCRCHCPVKGTTWGTSCPSCKKWKSIINRRTSKQATEDAWGNKNYPGSISQWLITFLQRKWLISCRLLQASSKTEKKSGKAAGGDGYQPVMMTFKVGILMVLRKGIIDNWLY